MTHFLAALLKSIKIHQSLCAIRSLFPRISNTGIFTVEIKLARMVPCILLFSYIPQYSLADPLY